MNGRQVHQTQWMEAVTGRCPKQQFNSRKHRVLRALAEAAIDAHSDYERCERGFRHVTSKEPPDHIEHNLSRLPRRCAECTGKPRQCGGGRAVGGK